MQIDNNTLIDDLLDRVSACTQKAHQFETLSLEHLRFRQNNQWNILECLEHLNLYGDFYLVEIERGIIASAKASNGKFSSGLIGNYFAELMQVKNGKLTKMKSPKNKDPFRKELTPATIARFIKQQEKLVELLNQSRDVDLTKTKCAISLTRLIRLRLGDTLRFFVYHIERHIQQAERMLQIQVGSEAKSDSL